MQLLPVPLQPRLAWTLPLRTLARCPRRTRPWLGFFGSGKLVLTGNSSLRRPSRQLPLRALEAETGTCAATGNGHPSMHCQLFQYAFACNRGALLRNRAVPRTSLPKCALMGVVFTDKDHSDVNGGFPLTANECQTNCHNVWYCEAFSYDVRTKARPPSYSFGWSPGPWVVCLLALFATPVRLAMPKQVSKWRIKCCPFGTRHAGCWAATLWQQTQGATR